MTLVTQADALLQYIITGAARLSRMEWGHTEKGERGYMMGCNSVLTYKRPRECSNEHKHDSLRTCNLFMGKISLAAANCVWDDCLE